MDMSNYRFRSVRPDGLVMHEFGASSADLSEAQAQACRLARSLAAAGPQGKSWGGWCVDVTDSSGRLLLRIPFAMALDEPHRGRSEERPGAIRAGHAGRGA
jgi:hypothetical protein